MNAILLITGATYLFLYYRYSSYEKEIRDAKRVNRKSNRK